MSAKMLEWLENGVLPLDKARQKSLNAAIAKEMKYIMSGVTTVTTTVKHTIIQISGKGAKSDGQMFKRVFMHAKLEYGLGVDLLYVKMSGNNKTAYAM